MSGVPTSLKDLKIQTVQKVVAFTNGVGTVELPNAPTNPFILCQILGYRMFVINTSTNGKVVTIAIQDMNTAIVTGDIWIRLLIVG